MGLLGRCARLGCCGVLLTSLAAGGCDRSVVGPDVLMASLGLSTDEVMPGDPFVVTYRIENPTDREVTLSSPDGCVALPSVYRDGARQGWEGTALGCLAAVSRHVVPAGGVLVRSFELRAAIPGGDGPYDYDELPEPGPYALVVEVHVLLPDLTVDFVVGPAAFAEHIGSSPY